MKKTLLLFLFSILLSVILVGCGAENDATKAANETEQETDKEENGEAETKDAANTTLPDGFPEDFPIPDEFTITKVKDKSNEDKNHYSLDFDFDPSLDMEPIFDLYKAYSEEVGYNIVAGGEEFFAEDIFQFGANDPKSARNMFMITLGTVDKIYGNIDVRFAKE